uniref:Translation initiation factor IF-2, chloroplastic n=1 Tax=Pterothamnion crispum TaxID=1550583 RepID=A0A4D6WX66_9FLOR|nr:Translation initiation factor 2 [Pterothamnion crispum]
MSTYSLCLLDSQEKVWYLSYPKLIEAVTFNSVTKTKSLVNINNTFVNISDKNSNLNSFNKFDKKNKSNSKAEDLLEIKKKKNKLQKKNRKQISLENEDLFISKTSKVILNDDNLNTELIKAHKINKNKKKSKLKQDFNESIINLDVDSNHLSTNKEIIINSPLTIQELSYKLSIPEAEIITNLFLKGISVTINQVIDVSIATDLASQYNFIVLNESSTKNFKLASHYNLNDSSLSNNIVKRNPIITILGHVDHGKTTLLESILNTNLVQKEKGGITQSIDSYDIEWLHDSYLYKLVFLDTPGHEAFSSMRMRGTQVTDIALLIVAADDGLKPQTVESIKYILDKQLPYIVVINKIDKSDINIIKIKEELASYNIIDEKWGGNAIFVEVSALKRQNIDTLLSNICILSDLQLLKANPDQLAQGTILEAHLDQKQGPIANIVVQNGTLKVSDIIISGNIYGKVKVILNNIGNKIQKALPSSIVQVLGFPVVPHAGMSFHIVHDKKKAKEYISENIINIENLNIALNILNNRVTLDSCNNNFNIKHINLILKTDTQGSSEAIINAFNQISQEKVQINILNISSGNISNNDIELALASNSLIIGFKVDIPNSIRHIIKKYNLSVVSFNVIYDLLDHITSYMLKLVDPEYDKVILGKAVVQTVFYINKGSVAGCFVKSGKLKKQSYLNIYRENELIHNGILSSLKRMKDDVDEVPEGNECGVMSNDYTLWKNNDIIEAYELDEKEKQL